jgi:hypothetical protein
MKKKRLKIFLSVAFLLTVWILIDLNYPYKTDIKNFNPADVARLDGAMWRSYYEKKKLKLLWQSAELMRKQFAVPFWRSTVMAYHAAKAAFIFKDGKNRDDYNKALPNLTGYYTRINNISKTPFDAGKAAKLELEWWIIRRYRNEHPTAEWEKLLAQTAEAMYGIPAGKFAEYAKLRVQAMLLRDSKGENITDRDWKEINSILQMAWASFVLALN